MVAIYQSTAEYQRMIRQQSLQVVLGLGLGSLVFIALLLYLVRRILTPLQEVARAADAIASGDLTAAIPRWKAGTKWAGSWGPSGHGHFS